MSAQLFHFGILADAQYADKEDAHMEGRSQRYREVPGKLTAALRVLAAQAPPLSFVLHMGDIIDGADTPQQTAADLDLIAGKFEAELGGAVPALHVLGNHCLSAGREAVAARLALPAPARCYYSRQLPQHGWRVVVLDTTEMSGHSGFAEGSPQRAEARAFEASHPLGQHHPQMSPWNGGIGAQQMAWLGQELRAAEAAVQRVIVASHHQVGAGAARATHMAWNWREIQQVVLASPAFRLALAGHDHVGGYAQAGPLQHFLTVEAILEAPAGSNAFAVVRVCADCIEVQGTGSVTSRTLAV